LGCAHLCTMAIDRSKENRVIVASCQIMASVTVLRILSSTQPSLRRLEVPVASASRLSLSAWKYRLDLRSCWLCRNTKRRPKTSAYLI